jgi:predicted nucleotidyltransferase
MQISTFDSNRVKNILLSFGITRAGIFGSQARNETHVLSDLDLLVEFDHSATLFDMIRLKHEIEDLLHMNVDVVEYAALNPFLRSNVLNDEIRLI